MLVGNQRYCPVMWVLGAEVGKGKVLMMYAEHCKCGGWMIVSSNAVWPPLRLN